jgi:DNA-binding transcriptional LysR family regulator
MSMQLKLVGQPAANMEHFQPADALSKLSWDDLKVFSACARASSFREAARGLKLSSSTVSRRIERLEYMLAIKLFHRVPEGVILTGDGALVAESALSMFQVLCDLHRKRSSMITENRGEVTIAVTEGLGSYWLMPRLAEFQRTSPQLTINLYCAMDSVDVLRLEADMAIQFTRPESADLMVVKLGRLHIFPFAAQSYLDTYGTPSTYEEVAHHRLVEQVSPQIDSAAFARYFQLSNPRDVVSVRTNSSTAHLYAIEKGAGIGGLPSFAAALGSSVVPVNIGQGHSFDIWLTFHPELRSSPHAAAAIAWVRQSFDPRTYPWFRDEFIHPNELSCMTPGAAAPNRADGCLAVTGAPLSVPIRRTLSL